MEVHFDEKTIVMDDYKSIKGYGIDINELPNKNSEKDHLEKLQSIYNCLVSGQKGLDINNRDQH